MKNYQKARGKIYRGCDALRVMESLVESTYDFIFLGPPHFTGFDGMIANKQKQEDGLKYRDFIKKIIFNASRLLKENGIVAFLAPGKENTDVDYKVILERYFPEVNNVVLKLHQTISNRNPHNHYFLYFCSPKQGYIFPILKEHKPKDVYQYEDDMGIFRVESLRVNKDRPALQFEWRGQMLLEGQSWRYNRETLDSFFEQERIIFMDGIAYLKKYRNEEVIQQSSVWEIDLSDIRKLGGNIDTKSLERIITMFVRPGDNILCPFDYDAKFSYIASLHNYFWTAVYYPKGKDTLEKVRNAEFLSMNDIKSNNVIQYDENIVGSFSEILELENKVKKLSLQIRDIQNSLNMNENEDESSIVDKIHKVISESEFAVNNSDNILEAQNWMTPYWNSLEPESQKFIPTGIMLYNKFINHPDMDMAPIMIEYCKALEKELYMKMFNGYVINLIERNVNIRRDFPDSIDPDDTKIFAKYLLKCLGRNRDNPREWKIELGTMVYILRMALDRPHQYRIIGDFRRYLDNIFEIPFFQIQFLANMGQITALRNDCAHPNIVNRERVTIGKEQIRTKLLALLQHYRL